MCVLMTDFTIVDGMKDANYTAIDDKYMSAMIANVNAYDIFTQGYTYVLMVKLAWLCVELAQ